MINIERGNPFNEARSYVTEFFKDPTNLVISDLFACCYLSLCDIEDPKKRIDFRNGLVAQLVVTTLNLQPAKASKEKKERSINSSPISRQIELVKNTFDFFDFVQDLDLIPFQKNTVIKGLMYFFVAQTQRNRDQLSSPTNDSQTMVCPQKKPTVTTLYKTGLIATKPTQEESILEPEEQLMRALARVFKEFQKLTDLDQVRLLRQGFTSQRVRADLCLYRLGIFSPKSLKNLVHHFKELKIGENPLAIQRQLALQLLNFYFILQQLDVDNDIKNYLIQQAIKAYFKKTQKNRKVLANISEVFKKVLD